MNKTGGERFEVSGRFSKIRIKRWTILIRPSVLTAESKQDIKGSMAHAEMLGKCGVIPEEDAALIVKTLSEVWEDIKEGKVSFDPRAEDIHMFVEQELIKRIGDTGKKLHTGRSRNDQVALDIRMYLTDECKIIKEMILSLWAPCQTAKTPKPSCGIHPSTACPAYNLRSSYDSVFSNV